MKREPIKTKIKDIVEYWFSRIDECGFNIDYAEAHERCWRCGCEKNLERCHIVPASLGGKDEPSNFVLLCKRCHIDNPNISDPEIMWDWIRAYNVSFYDIFWQVIGLKEYEFIYHKSFVQELIDMGLTDDEALKSLQDCLSEMKGAASYHFGHPYLNTATIAGALRMVLKKFAKKHNKEIVLADTSKLKPLWLEVITPDKLNTDKKNLL